MDKARQHLIDLETRFWQSMVDDDSDTAVGMLNEPALMVSQHGAIKFDHAGYRRMAAQGSMVIKSFQLEDVDVVFPSDDTAILTYRVTQEVAPRESERSTPQQMNDTSVWLRQGAQWRCVMHTETPVDAHAR